jgi:hypothetical protein
LRAKDLVADLLRGGTSVKESEKTVDTVCGNQALKIRAHNILEQVKAGKNIKDKKRISGNHEGY